DALSPRHDPASRTMHKPPAPPTCSTRLSRFEGEMHSFASSPQILEISGCLTLQKRPVLQLARYFHGLIRLLPDARRLSYLPLGAGRHNGPLASQYAFAITARLSTISPVTMHFPAPSYSSTSGIFRAVALNSLSRASQAGSS